MANIKDDSLDQIPLFELPQSPATSDRGIQLPQKTREERVSTGQPSRKTEQSVRPRKKVASKPAGYREKPVKLPTGPVPDGDVRLTANIRQELHLRLKIVAATRRTTIGELIEELVEQYL